MTLAPGTRLGPYEITSPLGAGGMGEVYRARDTRLERSVAIKVLPKELSHDADLKARFTREARAISALNHPHICALYDVGSEDGLDYLVMELLEGETLADRLSKGPLPNEQTLRYGFEIAEALDRAHRQGIVHRDLKPGNVMLTRSGVKLLDFGLAKLREKEAEPALSNLPTRLASKPLTERGTVLGTFQYMSPEQLEGKDVDARSDIFALGALLYEMSTGRKAFSGTSQASLIAAILSSEPPPISTIQRMSPPALDRLVKTCLAKDPDERWQSAHDVAAELRWIAEGGSQIGAPAVVVSKRKMRERLAWIASVLLAAAAAALAFGRRPAPPRALNVSLLPPPGSLHVNEAVLSPDGRRLALEANDADGRPVLFVRALDAPSPTRLPGTEDAVNPFWSPDGRSLGFFAHGKVQRIEVDGGRPQPICEALVFAGGTWAADGTILFGSLLDNIRRVPASGGVAVDVTPKTKDATHRWPFFLPDGRRYLYLDEYDEKSKCALVLASLDGKETRRLVAATSKGVFSEGRLLYVQSGTLMARRLDPPSGAVGEPVVLGDAIYDNDFGNFLFTASGGALAYGTEDRASRLQWFDRSGKELGTVGPPADYVHVELAPSDALAVVERRDGDDDDLVLVDLARDTFSRFTFGGAEFATAVFSPHGDRLAYLKIAGGKSDVYLQPIGGASAPERIGSSFYPTSFIPDGTALIGETWTTETKADVSLLRLKDGKVEPIVKKRGWENDARLSPDGRWLAYHSDESGTDEVYVQDFPAGTAKWQVSSGGGWSERWRADGRELIYVAPAGLFGAEVSPGAAFSAGKPKLLLRVRVKSYKNRCNFAITKDGARFLVNVDPPAPPMTLLLDWTARLAR
jgi:hypothetical protein